MEEQFERGVLGRIVLNGREYGPLSEMEDKLSQLEKELSQMEKELRRWRRRRQRVQEEGGVQQQSGVRRWIPCWLPWPRGRRNRPRAPHAHDSAALSRELEASPPRARAPLPRSVYDPLPR